MAQISCTVTNCYYNKRQGCTAPVLTVDGKNAVESRLTSCATFIEQKPGARSSVSEPQGNTDIKCDVGKCVYYKSDKCQATNILVNGKNAEVPEETCCSTFKCK
ncbi:MAG: DUF1540 domain-containing protein [Sedimentibacter sp.]